MQHSPKLLFTPGPLTTSPGVKQAMLTDWGSRDEALVAIVSEIRAAILKVAGVTQQQGFEAIPIQGSGTYAVEAVFASALTNSDRLLILVNGAYGQRMVDMAECYRLQHEVYEVPENEIHQAATIDAILSQSKFTHLAGVHCETTTGILNPIADWSELAQKHHCRFIVDAMSSFGGIPMNLTTLPIDFLVTSANKCLQGVPGIAFVIARRDLLLEDQRQTRSISLDLRQQLLGFQRNGQFRFTPPTQVLLACHQALLELEEEGGVERRAARYRENHQLLCQGMQELGFREYLPRQLQSDVITAFLYPRSDFDFAEFYRRLSQRGMLIYPGKLSKVDCFRIGNIGHIFPKDVRALLAAIQKVVAELNVA